MNQTHKIDGTESGVPSEEQMRTTVIETINLGKTFVSESKTETEVFNNLNFDIKAGEFVCLIGHSGCGKTTILRSIAGFVNIVDGEINYNGNLISTSTFHVPPENRRIGMVFQEPSLFPHLTIIQNIQAGLLKYDKNDIEQNKIIYDLISRMNLNNLLTKYPHEVSGGEQQRTALIRSIVSKPNLLLKN